MFDRLKTFIKSGRNRAGKAAEKSVSKRRKMLFEPMEERILLSADFGVDPSEGGVEQGMPAESTPGEIETAPEASPDASAADAPSLAFHDPYARELIFVDTSVPDYEGLLGKIVSQKAGAGLDSTASTPGGVPDSGVRIIALHAGRDAVTQITEMLGRYEDIETVHIVSHGTEGALSFGSGTLDAASLEENGAQLSSWGASLTPDADILLYGCRVAGGTSGIEFINRLSDITGADVAASDDVTGSSLAGGDWELENSCGTIEGAALFAGGSTPGYDHLLGPVVIEGTDLDDTITITGQGAGKFNVDINGTAQDYTLTADDPLLTFQGGLGQDKVIITGDLTMTDAGLVVNAEEIEVAAGATIDTGAHDITLNAQDTGTGLFGTIAEKIAELTPLDSEVFDIVEEAVLGAAGPIAAPIDYFSASTAVTLTGATLRGHDVKITTASTTDSYGNWPVFKVIGVGSSSDIRINGETHITATGDLTIASSSDVTVQSTAEGLGLPGIDGAVAVTVISSTAATHVSGTATLEASGSIELTADSRVTGTTLADGTVGGATIAGGSAAVSVIVSDAQASLDGAVSIAGATASGDDPALTIASTSSNTVSTIAVATKGGASGEGGFISKLLGTSTMGTGSAEAGAGTGTGTGEGGGTGTGTSPVSLAGSLALTVLSDRNDAHIHATDASKMIDVTGAVDVRAISAHSITTKADSSSVETPSASVFGGGIAAAVNVADLTNHAYLKGAPVFGAGTTAVNVKATMPADTTHTFSATAISGASSGAFGASGAFAMGVTVSDSHAWLAAGTEFHGGANTADLNLEAVNRTSSTVTATAQKTGATGFGAGGSLALNVGKNVTLAEIDKTAFLSDVGALSLLAEGEHGLDTTA
ncbi:DUF4347 domain-containing protein, partial [Desulfoluna sp.]|uniref:DUF4347 domain-containing protein n=1 Tax=Desulfoluna sp. TaxID=2045199 RepID=UPI0026217FCA